MKKKILSAILIVSIIANVVLITTVINNNKTIKTMEEEKAAEDLKASVAERVKEKQYLIADEKSTGDEAKRDIVKKLFLGYFTSNIKALADYKIESIEISETKYNKFRAFVVYDVQCAEGETYWAAGDGTASDNNWILGKSTYMEITENEGEHTAKFVVGE